MSPFSIHNFRWETFRNLQEFLTSIGDPPIPLPQPYITGFDHVVWMETTGVRGLAKYYLFGEMNNTGFIGYYLAAFLLKTPIPTLLFISAAIIRYFSSEMKSNFLDNELFLLGPVLYFTVYFNFFNSFQIGIRHFLVVTPLLLIFTSSLFFNWRKISRGYWLVVAALLLYLFITVMSYFPHFIPYFNEVSWDRRLSYKLLADSNIDWGQADWYLDRFLENNPDAIVRPEGPTSGTVILAVNDLVGITADRSRYQWLRNNFEPVDTIAYSYLVFRISPEDLTGIGNP
jgi:hypothetical protein